MSTTIILVQPQLPENIGAVARIMGNFGFCDLRIVDPKCKIDDDKAMAMAVASFDILKNAQIHSSFEAAVSDCTCVIGTTAKPRQMIKYYHSPRTLSQDMDQFSTPLALVFGPERTGLTNDLIAQCQALVSIPVNPNRSSLNLSHAVGIVLYELSLHSLSMKTESLDHQCLTKGWQTGKASTVSMQELDSFLHDFEATLDKTHFWRTQDKKDNMLRNLISMFKRQTWFSQDLKTLRGAIDALFCDKIK